MPIAVSDAVERLVKNRATLQIMSPLSESAADLSVETAYRIQRALESKLVEGGERVVGWKAGFTNASPARELRGEGARAGLPPRLGRLRQRRRRAHLALRRRRAGSGDGLCHEG